MPAIESGTSFFLSVRPAYLRPFRPFISKYVSHKNIIMKIHSRKYFNSIHLTVEMLYFRLIEMIATKLEQTSDFATD